MTIIAVFDQNYFTFIPGRFDGSLMHLVNNDESVEQRSAMVETSTRADEAEAKFGYTTGGNV